ncbi:MAG: hypothetical protein R3E39_19535 [Anaerolineae bacterium]
MLDLKLCPKCDGEMLLGRMGTKDDATDSYWVALKDAKILGRKTKVEDGKRITAHAYRCVRCGFLEHYAPDQNDAK